MTDAKPCNAHELRIKTLEMEVERLKDHHKFYKESINDGLEF